MLWAAYETITNNIDVLKLNKANQIAAISKTIVDTAADEEKFKILINDVSVKLADLGAQLSTENREKLRDSIRADSFFQRVKESLFPEA